jgi:protein-disulfide isomerase
LLAGQAGYAPLFVRCAVEHEFASWVANATRSAERAGIAGVPAVRVNGKRIGGANDAPPSGQQIAAAVAAAH